MTMLKPLTPSQKQQIDNFFSGMSLEAMIGQILCPVAWHFGTDLTAENSDEIADGARKLIETYQVGGLFTAFGHAPFFKHLAESVDGLGAIPAVLVGDMENGAGCRMYDRLAFPATMACGAANRTEWVREMGVATARESRECGIGWTLSPLVDLCLNRGNPMTFGRTFGSKPDHVASMARAFIDGVQEGGLMAATAKHFPGDGYEEREPHLCTPVVDLSRQEWFDSYGVTWKASIDAGVMAIMTGHIGLPFVDPGTDWRGAPPATLSKKQQLDFLRGELGFDGCIICDAVSMIGFASWVPPEERAWRCIESGTDCLLFANPEVDVPAMLQAVKEGKLSADRVAFAARKVLELKARIGLFDGLDIPAVAEGERAGWEKLATDISEHSITVVRDAEQTLPLSLEPGAKILTITLAFVTGVRHDAKLELHVVDEELRKRGFEVDHLVNPGWVEIAECIDRYAAVFVNLDIPPRYGSTHLVPPLCSAFWEGRLMHRPNVVYTAFGDPFKLYEMPWASNMVLTYCTGPLAQASAVKLWLGEIPAQGKTPVELKGYFECQV
jgi:beta-N-acetylhexosaminidase